ncbi:MAG: tannase/feruloyl esterase family alpha/beta hydrolase [Mycobacterium sp.]|nr:tannase/feruloyl esterase family alpha/beta hydrolase [Mycobacterium sp.]
MSDGIVSDVKACQTAFNINTDVPTCAAGTRDGSCLSTAQKTVLGNIFAGAKDSKGNAIYSNFYADPGVAGAGYADWQLGNMASTTRDPGALAFIFTSPPPQAALRLSRARRNFALDYNTQTRATPRSSPPMRSTTNRHGRSRLPPNETNLAALKGPAAVS